MPAADVFSSPRNRWRGPQAIPANLSRLVESHLPASSIVTSGRHNRGHGKSLGPGWHATHGRWTFRIEQVAGPWRRPQDRARVARRASIGDCRWLGRRRKALEFLPRITESRIVRSFGNGTKATMQVLVNALVLEAAGRNDV